MDGYPPLLYIFTRFILVQERDGVYNSILFLHSFKVLALEFVLWNLAIFPPLNAIREEIEVVFHNTGQSMMIDIV